MDETEDLSYDSDMEEMGTSPPKRKLVEKIKTVKICNFS